MSSRCYCFTYNNPTCTKEELAEQLCEWKCKYLVIGEESAPSTGTKHFQGYVYWSSAKPMTNVINKFKRIHFSVARGTAEENKIYCSKEDKDFIEYGSMPRQGTRSDISLVKDMVASGSNLREISGKVNSLQGLKHAECLMKYFEKKRDWKPIVEWYFGPTGTGKTRAAMKVFNGDDVWVSGKNLKWWEGYDGHENVLLDDFRKDFCTFHELLRILDRYEYRIECKGGSRQLLAKRIIITCPFFPAELYNTREDVSQLMRRIDVIKFFEKPQTETETEVEGVIIDPSTFTCGSSNTWE